MIVAAIPAVLYWILVSLVTYVYLGYPILILVLSKLVRRSIRLEDISPSVSVIITAYNEEESIAGKIESTLNLDYPAELLEVLVCSDGSTDRTDQIVESFRGRGVMLFRYEGRRGKTYCQNETVKKAAGDILVFTDATTVYQKDALKEIVRPFADESVGCVCAELSYVHHRKGEKYVGESEGLYWRIEKKLKAFESNVSSCVGASGALYAVRKSAYTPLDPGLISDFVEPLLIVTKGMRAVYHASVKCFDETAKTFETEFTRKVRTILRALNSLGAVRSLFNPFRHGIITVQLISHKFLRWLIPVFFILILVSNLFLLGEPLYLVLFAAQILFYVSAVVGMLTRMKPFSIAYYFFLINAAALVAIIQFLMGKNRIVWDTER